MAVPFQLTSSILNRSWVVGFELTNDAILEVHRISTLPARKFYFKTVLATESVSVAPMSCYTARRVRRVSSRTTREASQCVPWGTRIMHKQSIACDPEDVLSLDFEVVDGLQCLLWLDAKHGGGTGKRR